MAQIVSGIIRFPHGTGAFSGATLYASIETSAMMDAPAQIVAHSARSAITYAAGTLPFSIEGTLPQGVFNLRIHLSMRGNHEFERGDYLTKRAYRIQSDAIPLSITVDVERV
jgi:hypothetical protein